jgi:hypothetical protein
LREGRGGKGIGRCKGYPFHGIHSVPVDEVTMTEYQPRLSTGS